MCSAHAEFLTEDHVFAAYGRAMHSAQALEHWLRVLVHVNRTASKKFSSTEEADRAIDTLSTSTMGTVFAALRLLVDDPNLEDQLAQAVAERNRLAHKYFGQWADVWAGHETDIRMIEDADRVRVHFEETTQRLAPIIGKHLDTIGSNPDEYVPGLNQRIDNIMSQPDTAATFR
ncbi:hypothetical protein [Leifsonia sp. A12D58]|uniref:hypothetical protein n=1 Tax=Leifsonia sp. A12D58 TaxID=3397674 RepID=UPI0039E0A4C8